MNSSCVRIGKLAFWWWFLNYNIVMCVNFAFHFQDTYAVIGKPFWWTCEVEGRDRLFPLTFDWRKQDGADLKSNPNVTVYDNGTIYFQQVRDHDLGLYTCTVDDTQSSLFREVQLKAAFTSGQVSLLPRLQAIYYGGEAVMDCQFDAQPPPTFTWLFKGRRVEESMLDVTLTTVAPGHSMLKMGSVTYDFGGEYVCAVGHVLFNQPLSSDPATVQVYGKPYLRVSPSSQAVPQTYNVSFDCQVISQPDSTVVWTFSPLSLPSTSWILATGPSWSHNVSLSPSAPEPSAFLSLRDTDRTLTITGVRPDDAGAYSCTWTNQYGSVTANASLLVTDDPQAPVFDVRPKDTNVNEGDMLSLNCTSSGNPKPSVTWTHPLGESLSRHFPSFISDQQGTTDEGLQGQGNNAPPANVISRGEIDQFGTYTLKNVSRSDSGFYSCRISNFEGVLELTVYVNVLYQPYFVFTPHSITVELGSEVLLPCSANGNPEPVIHWSLPEGTDRHVTPLANAGDITSREILHKNGSLYLRAERLHHGYFTCNASNSFSSITAVVFVSVLRAPSFIESPASRGVVEGDNVQLRCQIDAYPDATIEWFHLYIVDPSVQSTDLKTLRKRLSNTKDPTINMIKVESERNAKYSLSNRSTLIISNISENLAGLYICKATNEIKSNLETAVLRVITFPRFEVHPDNQDVIIGQSVRLDCHSTGIPVPSQRWLFNHAHLEMTERKNTFSNGSLFISKIQIQEMGIYTCLATNQAGQRAVSAQIMPTSKPILTTRPSNTTASVGSTATLHCKAESPLWFETFWYISKENGDEVALLGQILINKTASISQTVTDGDLHVDDQRIQITPEGSLHISCLVEDDASWYMCAVRNDEGASYSSPVFVVVNSKPRIQALSVQEAVKDGENVIFQCEASGTPTPILSWVTPLKIEMSEEKASRDNLVLTHETVSLSNSRSTIRGRVDIERHSGDWVCTACNPVGCTTQQKTLVVEGKPVISHVVSTISENSISIICISPVLPKPELTYYSSNVRIDISTPGHTINGDELQINVVEAKSSYSCSSRNVHGSSTTPLTLPTGADLTDVTAVDGMLLITLKTEIRMPNLRPNRVSLDYRTNQSSAWQTQEISLSEETRSLLDTVEENSPCKTRRRRAVEQSSDDTVSPKLAVSIEYSGSYWFYTMTLALQHLQSHTVYSIRGKVGNVLGYGLYSNTYQTLTASGTPPEVENLVVSVRNRSALVTWTLTSPLNGRPEDVYTKVFLLNSKGNKVMESFVNSGLSETIFRDLTLGKFVIECIVANTKTNKTSKIVTFNFDVKDESPYFVPVLATTKPIDSHSIHVHWSIPPFPEQIIPPVTGYRLQVESAENPSNTEVRTIIVSNTSTSTALIRDLEENHKYVIRIASFNVAGASEFSESKIVVTPYAYFSQTIFQGLIPNISVSWQLLAIIVVCVWSVMLIVVVAIIVTSQVKMSRSSSMNLLHRPPVAHNINDKEETEEHSGYLNDGLLL